MERFHFLLKSYSQYTKELVLNALWSTSIAQVLNPRAICVALVGELMKKMEASPAVNTWAQRL